MTLRNLRIRSILVALSASIILITVLQNAVETFNSFKYRRVQVLEMLSSSRSVRHDTAEMFEKELKNQETRPESPSSCLNNRNSFDEHRLTIVRRQKLMEALYKLSLLSIEEKRRTLVYIPKTNRIFWKAFHRCKTVPFLIPSMTGMAMLHGLPDTECETNYYGYDVYERSAMLKHEEKSTEILCREATLKGFSAVIILTQNEHGELSLHKTQCAQF